MDASSSPENFQEKQYNPRMDIHSLSTSERILLAEELWDSVHEKSDEIELTAEQIKLLETRLAAYEEDGDPGDSWEIVRARIQSSL